MKWYDTTAFILAGIGAVNWGLFALGGNLVRALPSALATIVYWLIAISGVWVLARVFK